MEKRNLILVNGLLMKRTLTEKKARRLAESLVANGKQASWAKEINKGAEPLSTNVWAFLNKGAR